jgi:hypothetical protein
MLQNGAEKYAERVHAGHFPAPPGYISWVESLSRRSDTIVGFHELAMRPEHQQRLGGLWPAVYEGGMGLATSLDGGRRLMFWFYLLLVTAMLSIISTTAALCFIDWDLCHRVAVCLAAIIELALSTAIFVVVCVISYETATEPKISERPKNPQIMKTRGKGFMTEYRMK